MSIVATAERFSGIPETSITAEVEWTLSGEFPNELKIPETSIQLRLSNEDKKIITTFVNLDESHPIYELCRNIFRYLDGAADVDLEIRNYVGTIVLTMYNNGEALEEYTLYNAWMSALNFGEECYSSNPDAILESTWGYESCEEKLPPWNPESNDFEKYDSDPLPIYDLKVPENDNSFLQMIDQNRGQILYHF